MDENEIPQVFESEESEVYQFELPEEHIEETHDDKDDIREQLRAEREAKAALESRLASLERQQQSAQAAYIPQPQVQQVNTTPVNRQELAKQLTDQFYADPGNALLNIFETAQAAARQELQKSLIPVQGATVRGAIANYRATANMPKEVLEEFDAMVKRIPHEQLASVDPAHIPDYLSAFQKMAYGEAAIAGKLVSNRHIPVNLGGGSGARGATGKKSLPITKAQHKNAESLRQAGWSEKDILQALKDGDLD